MERLEMNENQLFVVSLDNGIKEEEPINIKVYDTFNDGSQLVELNNAVFGVYKSNSLNPDTEYIDDYDIIKADLAELLDIDHEEVHRVVNSEKNVGVFTLLNYSKDMETRISATSIFNNIVRQINEGQINGADSLWFTNTLKISEVTKGNGIINEEQIKNIIEMGICALTHTIESSSGMPLEEKKKKALRKSYLRMILFDLLIGRKYRGLDYYLISSVNQNQDPIWLDARFGPISISSSIEKDNSVNNGEYSINNFTLNRKALLKVLYDNYYYEIKKITEQLTSATKLYKEAMNIIIYNNTTVDKGTIFEDVIDEALSQMNELQKEKNKVLKKEINNVERTTETHSINIGVMKKYAFIIKKYSGSPTPEAIKKAYEKRGERLSLMVENNLKAQGGFVSTATIISIIAFVCGVAFGIVYVLITFGNY